MTTLVIKSNHGNHTGFNRTWEILNLGYAFDNETEAAEYLGRIADELDEQYDSEKEEFISHGPLTSFEEDLYYYYVITEEEYNDGFFNGGHYGYPSKKIVDIFENN